MLRDALVAADTVLAMWREPLQDLAEAEVGVGRSVDLEVRLPAHRLMPVALVASERHLAVVPVCSARTLAEGRPPMGIACAQQGVARVSPLRRSRALPGGLRRVAADTPRLADAGAQDGRYASFASTACSLPGTGAVHPARVLPSVFVTLRRALAIAFGVAAFLLVSFFAPAG